MKKTLLVFTVLSIFIVNCRAQEDISQYFDDDGISEYSKLVKIGIDLFNGEYSVLYEKEIIRNLSVEASMGLISISRQSNLHNYDPRYDLPQSGTGIFFAANIRLYLREYYEQWYIGVQPKLNIMGGKLMTDIVFFNGGYQLPLQKNLTLDINLGMGVRTYKYKEEVTSVITIEEGDSHFYFPAAIKLGYAF
ncbi:DUF3575 domain-containing protein [Marinilabilia salmonicolor]|uniref:DUF3575 domain-containing protein n=1 Tax=Marinilabilia salmonicolor TaxID=989 RepID=UPI00029ACA89|nr:DUF3575 domain-containing protein [Marinilabilia salmonicolor]